MGCPAPSQICGQAAELRIYAAWQLVQRYISYMCSTAAGDARDGLSAVLDALAGEDLFGSGSAELLARTAELVAARNRTEAELTRTVRRAESAQAAERDRLGSMAS